MQPDTLIPDLSNPQSWNRFSYVSNNPVNFNDPTGHCPECAPITLAGIGVIGIGAIFIAPEVLAIAAGVAAVTILALATIAVIDWAKSGLPSNKYRKNEADLSTAGKIADGNPGGNGPILRGGGRGCKNPITLILLCIGGPIVLGSRVLKGLTSGAYGEDESVDQLPNVVTPTPTSTQTLSPTMIPTSTPTSTPTPTPSSTPTSTPTSVPTSTPAITPTPHIIPKPSNHGSMIPI